MESKEEKWTEIPDTQLKYVCQQEWEGHMLKYQPKTLNCMATESFYMHLTLQ